MEGMMLQEGSTSVSGEVKTPPVESKKSEHPTNRAEASERDKKIIGDLMSIKNDPRMSEKEKFFAMANAAGKALSDNGEKWVDVDQNSSPEMQKKAYRRLASFENGMSARGGDLAGAASELMGFANAQQKEMNILKRASIESVREEAGQKQAPRKEPSGESVARERTNSTYGRVDKGLYKDVEVKYEDYESKSRATWGRDEHDKYFGYKSSKADILWQIYKEKLVKNTFKYDEVLAGGGVLEEIYGREVLENYKERLKKEIPFKIRMGMMLLPGVNKQDLTEAIIDGDLGVEEAMMAMVGGKEVEGPDWSVLTAALVLVATGHAGKVRLNEDQQRVLDENRSVFVAAADEHLKDVGYKKKST